MSTDSPLDQAIAHHIKGQLNDALKFYVKTLQDDPHTPGATNLISAILRTYLELALTLIKVGRDQEAIQSFQQVLAIQPDESVAHAYLSRLFISFNDFQQASVHLRHYLRLVPEDHIGARMLLAHTGAEAIPERPAASYITRYYDNYAASYDHKLVEDLQYQCPQIIFAALRKHCQNAGDILDLGCGTGLCGQAVRSLATRLDGVDLSPQMIAKARERSIYNELEVADIYSFMERKASSYDVIVAAGVFEHVGDPSPIFQSAFGAVRDRGLFIFTAEDNQTQNLSVNSSGYYMHSRTYLEERAKQCGFSTNSLESVTMRIDNGTPVPGLCAVLTKA